MNDPQLLEHEETLSLIQAAQNGSSDAKEMLVLHNTALVKSIVKKFLGRGVDFDDLFQIGCIGLIKAIMNYRYEFGVRFSTYAVPMIMGEIKRFLRDDGFIKISRSVKEIAIKAIHIKETLKKETGREPTINEISEKMEVSSEEIVFALDAVRAHISIDEPISSEGSSSKTLLDSVSSEKENESEMVIDKILLKEILQNLQPKERQLIILRYFKDKTQSEVSVLLGVSQVQVSRLEAKILKRIREESQII